MTQLFAIFGMPVYVHSDRGPSSLSVELKQFLHSHGISTSLIAAHSPPRNGQVERYNGSIWQAIALALKPQQLLATAQWEIVLPDALHSIRSLLCTVTNATPHERLFSYQQRSTNGVLILSWLATPGIVLTKRHVRH